MHTYHNDPSIYFPIITCLGESRTGNRLRILNIGCEDGSFVKSLILLNVQADYFGIDVSSSMINMARQNISGYNANLIVGDLFRLSIKQDLKLT